jgi:hypothetical protein
MQADNKKFLSPLIATLAIASCLTPTLTSAQSLGRLFFSPQERRQLDARRSAKPIKAPIVQTSPRISTPSSPIAVQANGETTKPAMVEPVVNGFVRRSSGINTVWVNEKPLSGAAAREELLQPSAVNTPVRVQSSNR